MNRHLHSDYTTTSTTDDSSNTIAALQLLHLRRQPHEAAIRDVLLDMGRKATAPEPDEVYCTDEERRSMVVVAVGVVGVILAALAFAGAGAWALVHVMGWIR